MKKSTWYKRKERVIFAEHSPASLGWIIKHQDAAQYFLSQSRVHGSWTRLHCCDLYLTVFIQQDQKTYHPSWFSYSSASRVMLCMIYFCYLEPNYQWQREIFAILLGSLLLVHSQKKVGQLHPCSCLGTWSRDKGGSTKEMAQLTSSMPGVVFCFWHLQLSKTIIYTSSQHYNVV